MRKLALILAGLATFLFSPALAQENIIISPQSIVINPYATEAYDVEVFVDKDTSGDLAPAYNLGDNISLSVRTNQDSYVYLFNVRSDGTINQIIPNRFDDAGKDNYVAANTTKTFPPVGAAYRFSVDAPMGLDKVIAVASKTQLDVTELANFRTDPNFASSNIGEQGFARTLSIIVNPIEQNDWVTDTVLFYVVDNTPPPPPIYGALSVTANVNNAAVYIDDSFRGYTRAGQAISVEALAGAHRVRIAVDGYDVFEQNVNVLGGQSTNITATLTPVARQGTVNFDSNPRGSTVLVNGVNAGQTPTGAISYPAGTYTATFRRAGYQDTSQSFSVSANSNQNVSVNMVQVIPRGTVNFDSNPRGATVYVDGNVVGTTPTGALEFNAGTYTATYRIAGYADASQQFTVAANQNRSISSTMVPPPPAVGTLVLRPTAPNPRVFINGKDYGTIASGTTGRIRDLPAGQHELTVVADGYTTYCEEIVITGGRGTEITATQNRR